MNRSLRAWGVVGAGIGALLVALGASHVHDAQGWRAPESLWSLAGGAALVLAGVVALIVGALRKSEPDVDVPDRGHVAAHPYVTLFIASFSCLFLEVMLIRYAGSQVRIFSFYKNIPLMSCYLGMGLGAYLRGGRARHAMLFLAWLVPLAVVLSLGSPAASLRLGSWAASGSSEHILGDVISHQADGHTALASQAFVGVFAVGMLVSIALLFVTLGRLLGEAFAAVPRLAGYTVNIAGSLVGVLAFVGISALWAPPWVWFAVGLTPLLWWLQRPSQRFAGAALVAVSALVVAPSVGDTVWSPYQRLTGQSETLKGTDISAYRVDISDVFYQVAVDLRPGAVATYGRNPFPHYDGQFAGLPKDARVLVVGAGTGNDVAAALRAGASRVDAVDIDPAIVRMGREHHPEHPYDDPRVHVVVDDARAAFRTLPPGYDAVVFGLLDSHTQLGISSVRLDNYVFTLESFAAAKHLLAPGGRILVTAATFRDWFRERLAKMLATTCLEPVTVRRYAAWTTYSCSPTDHPDTSLASLAHDEVLPTDDWPYLYLPQPTVPGAYVVVIGMLAVASVSILRAHGLRVAGFGALQWHLFFMGAAFLLVEVHAINRLALLFGSTWLVSALAISLILVLILVANLIVSKWRSLPTSVVWVALFASLAMTWVLNGASVSGLGHVATALHALVQVLPACFAGIIFARSFEQAKDPGHALGANMLGSVLGGWIEYSSMAIGIRALVILAVVLYLCALLGSLRARANEAAPAT